MADSANLAHIQGIANVFVERLRGLCAGEADSADLAHIERHKVFRAFSGGCVLGWLIQPTWHTFKELSTFLSIQKYRHQCHPRAANFTRDVEQKGNPAKT